MSFTVAIVGRPNVGKSTLFNRLVGKKLALVDDTPGVTRDRRPGDARLVDLKFRIIDTAGLEEAAPDTLEGRMRAQTEAAIEEADLSLFVVDAKTGLTPVDTALADMLRRKGKPVVLVANKSEARGSDGGFYDSFTLGLGEPTPISAEHGQGMLDLRDAIVAAIGEERAFPPKEDEAVTDVDVRAEAAAEDEDFEPEYDETKPLRVAIVGRPNAGKSTLINRFLGEDRLLTGPEAGITRDSILVPWEYEGRTINLVDTAGIRRKARVEGKLEKLAVSDSLRSLQYAEVVVLLLDAQIPFEKQDLALADLVEREGRALVIALNKWDTIEDKNARLAELREECERLLPQLRGVPLVTISGLQGRNLDKLMQAIFAIEQKWNSHVSTTKLNRWLGAVTESHPPPAVSGRRVKMRYMTQAKIRPPSFIVFSTRAESVPASYQRYLVNSLRESFNLQGTPIRLWLRSGKNPFAKKD